jgi:uncharacterized protein (TIGR02996 family)
MAEFPSNPELEGRLIENPDDDAARAVFTDWILEQGGSLEEELPADLAEAVESGHLVVTWHKGFLQTAGVGIDEYDDSTDIGPIVGKLLALPQARLLFKLEIGNVPADGEMEFQSVVDAIASAGGSRSLGHLILADYDQELAELSWGHLGNLGALWPLLPNLRTLRLRGGSMTVGNISLPRLGSLEVETGGLSGESARAFGEGSFPELVSMNLYLGTADYGGPPDDEDLAPLLAGKGLPKITSLGLVNDFNADARVAAVAGAALLPRLTHLDLSMGCMSDVGGAVLVREAARFRHLKQISVGENYLTGTMCGQLLEVYGDRMTGLLGQREDEGYRYTVVGE